MTSRVLRMLYREIPTFTCRPNCTDCCGPVPWSAEEIARVQDDIPKTAHWVEIQGVRALSAAAQLRCPFASDVGCQVYDRRPFICRLFGAGSGAPLMECPHGCRPKTPLSVTQTQNLSGAYIKLSRSEAP